MLSFPPTVRSMFSFASLWFGFDPSHPRTCVVKTTVVGSGWTRCQSRPTYVSFPSTSFLLVRFFFFLSNSCFVCDVPRTFECFDHQSFGGRWCCALLPREVGGWIHGPTAPTRPTHVDQSTPMHTSQTHTHTHPTGPCDTHPHPPSFSLAHSPTPSPSLPIAHPVVLSHSFERSPSPSLRPSCTRSLAFLRPLFIAACPSLLCSLFQARQICLSLPRCLPLELSLCPSRKTRSASLPPSQKINQCLMVSLSLSCSKHLQGHLDEFLLESTKGKVQREARW